LPRPRKTQVALSATSYYHCVSRCVRRAFLCGRDPLTGTDFSHRRGWIEDRILKLTDTFAVDVCAYAVMSNHVHVVLHVDEDLAVGWTLDQVIGRWHGLFNGSFLSQRYSRGESLGRAELTALHQQVAVWRERLQDISWYMRCLNEAIARQANREDNCTGRFWEGRFKCQALLDEKALAACLAYVDLNPVRAKMAGTPEASDYTSIRQRILHRHNDRATQPRQLHPFAGNPREDLPAGLPFRLNDYLELVDWTGRQLRDGKRGAIPQTLPPILERLAIEPRHWLYMSRYFESRFKGLVGTAYSIKAACQQLGYRRCPGLSSCKALLG
jgi:REP element-mobilizing transposase RayT